MIDYTLILVGSFIAGMVIMVNGVVKLAVRNKTGVWKDGAANFLAGIIVAGVSTLLGVWLAGMRAAEMWVGGAVVWWSFLIAGLVLLFNGVVGFAVRKKTGRWKDGGANFVAGIFVAGMSIGVLIGLGLLLIPPPID